MSHQDGVLAAVGAVGLVGVGLIHLVDLFDMWEESKYMAVLFAALVVGVTVAAAMLLAGYHRVGWMLGGGLALATIAGFVISRSIGVPDLAADVGNWKEPLGVAALFVEGLVVAMSVAALAVRRSSVPAPAVEHRRAVTV